MRREAGFSLIELVVAGGITLVVVAGLFTMLHPSHGAFETGVEAADMQQRLRVAVDALIGDLTMAGAGAFVGGHVGPLMRYVAPVMPFRRSQSAGDPAGTFRPDTITILSVPATAAQTTLAADLLPPELTLQASTGPGCPLGVNLCGFKVGTPVLVFDGTGAADAFTVAAVNDAAAQLTLTARPEGAEDTIYKQGSTVVEARLHTYFLKLDSSSHTWRLMHSDGTGGSDVPVVDHVVSLGFEYEGEPRPPSLMANGETSYGPAPPAAGTKPTGYPAGENCAFRIDEVSGLPVGRLAELTTGTALVPLAEAQFTDGPWCPDETSSNRWDADLLRIRRVHVRVRVEAAAAALRGPAGALFANGGTSRGGNRWLPDQELRFQVAPRNMNLERE